MDTQVIFYRCTLPGTRFYYEYSLLTVYFKKQNLKVAFQLSHPFLIGINTLDQTHSMSVFLQTKNNHFSTFIDYIGNDAKTDFENC